MKTPDHLPAGGAHAERNELHFELALEDALVDDQECVYGGEGLGSAHEAEAPAPRDNGDECSIREPWREEDDAR
ncbi:hypothetical protein FZEAL_8224 [Fusarium zealandicum]|uniref:Uncharacterized protein n=1 Tax=Fusarium zealandicum TaxID=1053134 RepID=A0A8H4XH10_9HYPO|nr:hypothetical protein FZEAL_8224 [Fusarium zealandicum]